MLNKILVLVMVVSFLPIVSGCIPLIAGAAGGAGTAVWLSGKLTQEFHKPYENTVNAAKQALRSLKLDINKETKQDTVTQLKSNYSDGKEIWMDIHKISEESSRVEVRVGTIGSNKEAASKILKKIEKLLI
mgnify:CR=1 FL=1